MERCIIFKVAKSDWLHFWSEQFIALVIFFLLFYLKTSVFVPISNPPNKKRAGGVSQVVECLPSKCEALSSNPITTIKS
jgi:uncharacterized membrane protein